MSFGLKNQQKIFVKFRKIFHKFSSSAEPEQGNSQLGLGGHLSISISNFYCGSGGRITVNFSTACLILSLFRSK